MLSDAAGQMDGMELRAGDLLFLAPGIEPEYLAAGVVPERLAPGVVTCP